MAMKVIIAGTREVTNYKALLNAIENAPFEITEVVSGCCRGVDQLGERWAKENGIPTKIFRANFFQYGKRAGPLRNKEMAEYADALIAIWDGKSNGTKDMINKMKRVKKPYKIKYVY